MEKPIKILMVTESFRIGGKERRLLELLKGLRNYPSIECHVVLLKDLVQYQGVDELPYKVTVLRRIIKKDPTIAFRLRKLITLYQPDIIHTWGGMASVYAIPLGKMMGIKTVNGMVTNSTRLKLFSENWNRSRLTFPFSDVVLSNSKAGLRAYGVNGNKGKVVYNGFNPDRLGNLAPAQEVRQQFGLATPYIIGMVGALHDRKDFFTFIKAARRVLSVRTDTTFVIVGDGPNFEICKQLAGNEFNQGIRFLGKQSDVESIVNTFAIGVLATNQRIHGEGISNSIMEYMALGKPVIATEGGGNGEIVLNGETGYLVREFSATELADKINYLLGYPELSAKMGQRGRERVERFFSIDQMVEGTLEVYRGLVKG